MILRNIQEDARKGKILPVFGLNLGFHVLPRVFAQFIKLWSLALYIGSLKMGRWMVYSNMFPRRHRLEGITARILKSPLEHFKLPICLYRCNPIGGTLMIVGCKLQLGF